MKKNHAKLWQYCEAHKPPPDEHAWMSPSSFHRTLRCPASVQREHALRRRALWQMDQAHLHDNPVIPAILDPRDPDQPDPAQDGTACHKVFEECTMALETPTEHFTRVKLQAYGASASLLDDPPLIDSLIQVIDSTVTALDHCDWQENEIRLPLVGCASFGTADLVFEKNGVLHVWDLKTGRQEVQAQDNDQLMAYASGVLDAIGYETYKKVSLGIVAIRFPSNFWETNPDVIRHFRDNVMRPQCESAHSLSPRVNVGTHCLYCPCKLHCPDWNRIVSWRVENENLFAEPMGELGDEELVTRYLWSKQVERFQKEAKTEIALRFEGFGRMEGETRVRYIRPAPIVDYVDDTAVIATLEKTLSPVEQEEFIQKRAVNPARLKAYVSEETYKQLTRVKARKPYVKMT